MSTDLPVPIPSGFARKLAPFGIPAVAGYLVALLPSDATREATWLAAAGALLALSALVTALAPWDRMPRHYRVVPPLAYIGVLALMRMGTDGSTSAFIPLLLLPLVWLALYGTRGELVGGFVAAASVLFLTGTTTGAGLQHSLLAVIVTPAVCFTIQRLVSRVRRQAALLEDLTNGDELTGAITKRAWDNTLERELIRAARTGEAVTVAVLNFDAFEKFNARFGADAGDDVLRSSVAAWRRELRAGDLLGRIDGDTFAVALPACTAEQAHEVVERLRVATTDLQTCSIGLAQYKQGESSRHLIERATAALQAAKQQGRDRTVVALQPITPDPALNERSDETDILASPTLLEQAVAQTRSLNAELHAVAEASAAPQEDHDDDERAPQTVAAATSEAPAETPGAAEAASPAPDGDRVEAEATEAGDGPEKTAPDESHKHDVITVHSTAAGDPRSVDAELDDLLAVRGAKEIHKLLRDLSSAR